MFGAIAHWHPMDWMKLLNFVIFFRNTGSFGDFPASRKRSCTYGLNFFQPSMLNFPNHPAIV